MIRDLLKRAVKSPFGRVNPKPGGADSQGLPLDKRAPWPKFRGNGLQNGRMPVTPDRSDSVPWEFPTAKGIFSSPVIDGDGTVYIGSADHYFYAVTSDGRLKWRFATGEIIDSSALLDNRNRVYFGSGDGHTYCLDRETGREIWRFAAHTTDEVALEFGIKTYNLNWFEGNVALLADGTLLAPNDNYLVYRVDRDTGRAGAVYPANEMVWSCPAVNADTGRIFFCSCFNALVNVFCYDTRTGKKVWTSGGLGSVSASPLLTSGNPDGAVLVGGFDGILRALSQKNGRQLWAFGTRDHIYGSPAQLSDGTIVQASCDGTVYGLDPDTGRAVWYFDTPEPIRSSPVVDGSDRIYFGSGEGRLYCIHGDGSFRWAYQCITGDRNDLNGSPALGPHGVFVAGENGSLFFVPYDWPLTGNGQKDPRSLTRTHMPPDGCQFQYVNHFGRPMASPPDLIDANEPVMLSHLVRKDGKTLLSAIDGKSLEVTVAGSPDARIALSANKKFIILIPGETWTGQEGGVLDIHVRCRVRTRLKRIGLKFFSGNRTHEFDGRFRMGVASREAAGQAIPYEIPKKPGDPATVLEISRLSCPSPTMLPSYNQIGFDSLHYLAVMVAGTGTRAVLWVVPGRLDGHTGNTLVDPALADVHVMEMAYDNGLVTLYNYDGFEISFVGSWDMPFGLYRMAFRVDPATGRPVKPAALSAVIRCDDIRFYGRFLKLTGMSDMKTGRMHICGGLNLDIWDGGDNACAHACANACAHSGDRAEEGLSLTIEATRAVARFETPCFRTGDHVWGILMLDTCKGRPIPLNYARKTLVETDGRGLVTEIILDYGDNIVAGPVRGLVMQDTRILLAAETVVST